MKGNLFTGKSASYPVCDNFKMFREALAYFISTCPRVWGGS